MTEKIIALTAEHLGIDADSISETSSFKEDLGVDSLDLFELVMELEEEFGIEIPSEDLENLATVADVAKYKPNLAKGDYRGQWHVSPEEIELAKKMDDVVYYPKRHGNDFYHHYKEDIALFAEMGFRL